MRVASGKSFGFRFLVWGLIATLILSVFIAPASVRLIMALTCITASILLLWIWYGTSYELNETHLIIRYGPFREQIPYYRIFSVRKITSMVSSMALSSRMIEIRHGKNYFTGTTCISPVDRDDFLRALIELCPNLKPSEGNF